MTPILSSRWEHIVTQFASRSKFLPIFAPDKPAPITSRVDAPKLLRVQNALAYFLLNFIPPGSSPAQSSRNCRQKQTGGFLPSSARKQGYLPAEGALPKNRRDCCTIRYSSLTLTLREPQHRTTLRVGGRAQPNGNPTFALSPDRLPAAHEQTLVNSRVCPTHVADESRRDCFDFAAWPSCNVEKQPSSPAPPRHTTALRACLDTLKLPMNTLILSSTNLANPSPPHPQSLHSVSAPAPYPIATSYAALAPTHQPCRFAFFFFFQRALCIAFRCTRLGSR